ncbi:vancomycin resistance protein YoaR [Allocatelliglobosispora scoriae]|uniref:Vancomycin resistance protein YoaR n=1 Tax=Allocatelliglobosispora scoriae TaxID=643052 RepID=A0A841BTC4_9ACTN|nr:vancomycin resistance protein YoaR [Allocatelliglobosispora scoriae]
MLSAPTLRSVSSRRRWLAAGVAAVLVLGIAAVGYANVADVPRGVTVLGIQIGGRTRAEAADALRAGLAARSERLAKPLTVHIADENATVQPEDVGLTVDVDATIDAAAATARNPLTALASIFGRDAEVEPVVGVDGTRLMAALTPAAAKVGTAMTMPAITFAGTTPTAVHPKAGRGLDPASTADAVRAAWLRADDVTVPLTEIAPVSTTADVDRLLAELATPAVAGPVTVTTDKGTLTATPKAIAASLVIDADAEGRLTPHVDEKKLRAALSTELAKVETQPKNASVSADGGAPKVVASTGGVLVDAAQLAKDLLPVLPLGTARSVRAAMKTVEPGTTDGELAKLGIREQVSSFTTRFSGGLGTARSKNIVQIAKEVDGAIVQPGETFSLNGRTGVRGYDEGYSDAPVIMEGKLVPGVGGGASQFTTTLFNAAYYAGLKDIEHKPHSYYFSRYPAVIESTIFYPDLDLKFQNTTDHGILIDTSYTKDSITVSMWSTKVYDSVTTEYGAKRDIRQPEEKTLKAGPDCIATAGSEGFTQDAWRVLRKDGKVVQRDRFTWTYDPEPTYTCGR